LPDKKNQTKVIAIEDLAYNLGLLEQDVLQRIERDKPDIYFDHRGRKSVCKTFIERYANADDYTEAFTKAIIRERALKEFDVRDKNQKLKEERVRLLNLYDIYIRNLENIHRKYLELVNNTGHESSTTAAYLLFSRVISTLKMCCLCQRYDHWYWGSHLRDIDECLDVALNFHILKHTPKGKVILRQWFRENTAPQHKDCREAISENMAAVANDYTKTEQEALMNELYHKKSKFTHPVYGTIREVTKYKISSNGIPCIEIIEYGASSYEGKLFELTKFFESSILTSFQVFTQCFRDLPLIKEDLAYCITLIKNLMSNCSISMTSGVL